MLLLVTALELVQAQHLETPIGENSVNIPLPVTPDLASMEVLAVMQELEMETTPVIATLLPLHLLLTSLLVLDVKSLLLSLVIMLLATMEPLAPTLLLLLEDTPVLAQEDILETTATSLPSILAIPKAQPISAVPLDSVFPPSLLPSTPASANGDTLALNVILLPLFVHLTGAPPKNEMFKMKKDLFLLHIVKMEVFVFLPRVIPSLIILLLVCALILGLVLVANGTPLSGLLLLQLEPTFFLLLSWQSLPSSSNLFTILNKRQI